MGGGAVDIDIDIDIDEMVVKTVVMIKSASQSR